MIRNVTRAFVAVVLGYSLVFAWSIAAVRADAPPTQQQIELAQRSSDLMLATLFAALLQELRKTTPANVEEGKHSISLIFHDRNDSMRLVGEQQPLRDNDVPQDPFEVIALERAMQGQSYTAGESGRQVGLSAFGGAQQLPHRVRDVSRELCPVNPAQVGALMLQCRWLTDTAQLFSRLSFTNIVRSK